MKRLSRWIGRCMLFGAFLLFTAIFINPMRLGGEASGGKIEEGRYFVVSNGHRYTEISEIEWRIERYLEWCFFLPVVLIWIGMAFRFGGETHHKNDVPKAEAPSLKVCGAVIGVTAVGAGAGWLIGRVPWTAVLGAWLGLWAGAISVGIFQSRASDKKSIEEPDASQDSSGM